MNEVLTQFQEDLRNGLTISEGLQKYNLTLKYAFENMRKPKTVKSKRKGYVRKIDPEMLHIQKRKHHYYVRKQVGGKTMMFGTYHSLRDAQLMRDYCIEHGWKQRSVDKYCRELGIERIKDHRCTVRYH